MAEFVHHKWEPSGRTRQEVDVQGNPTGRYMFTSRHGEHNIDDGQGSYAPYLFDPKAKVIRFADSELRLTDTGLEFWIDGEKKLSSSLHLETKTTYWERKTSTVSGLKFTENTDTGKLTIYYKIATDDQELGVTITVGREGRIHFAFEKVALKSGEQSIVWETEDTTEVKEIIATYAPEKNKELKTVGLDFGGHEIRWDYTESDDRELNGLKTGEKTAITIDKKVYSASEILIISPDTWGATTISDTDDDCQEADDTTVDLDGYDSDGNWVGNYSSHDYDIGLRWDNVNIATGVTIGDGCKIELFQGYSTASQPDTLIKGVDEADAANWDSGTRPSQRSKVAATVAWTPSNNDEAYQSTPEIKTIIDDIINGGSWAQNNAIALVVEENTSLTARAVQFRDYSNNSAQAAKLTIVYTTAGTTYQGTAADGFDMGETIGSKMTFSAVASDGLSMGESRSGILTMLAAAVDGISAGDVASGGLSFSVTGTDGLSVGDAAANQLTMPVLASDGAEIGDASTTRAILQGTAVDGLTMAEAIAVTAIWAALASDGVELSDTGIGELAGGLIGEAIDGFSLGDAASNVAQLVALALDGVDFSDSATTGSVIAGLAADGVTFTDSAQAILTMLAAAIDGGVFGDLASSQANFRVSCTDAASFGATVGAVMTFLATAADVFNMGDVAVHYQATGVVTMSVSVSKPGASVSAAKPGITFTVSKPSITIN